MGRYMILLAGLFGSSSVALGAWASHGLKGRLAPEALDIFHTAVHYQQIHALALLGAGLLALYRPSRWVDLSGGLFVLGILGFSGTLYARTLWDIPVGFITPLGGVTFMLAWLMLGIAAWRTA